MATKTDLVENHLVKLFRHKELLAAAYHRGVVSKADDKFDGRGLYELHQARALVPYANETYRLASSLARHFDEILQTEHLYAAVGADVGDLAARLPLLSDAVAKAAIEGRNEDADEYIDQFDRAVFELADSISGALQFLRILADNKFANVATYAEKKRQNEFYLERVRKISDALVAIQTSGLIESLESSPEGERLLLSYRSQIADHLPEWRANLLDITAILREYLFRTRQIEATARRFRAFALFLKRTPEYVPPDIDALADLPDWAYRAPGFALRSRASVNDPALDDPLLEIAKAIPAAKQITVTVPKAGTLKDDPPVAPGDEGVKPKLWQEAVQSLITTVGKQPVSAMSWKRRTPSISDLPNDIWLLCLLHEESLRRRRTEGIRFEQILEAAEPLSGMLKVRDILVSRADQ
ncbi:MAG: hypothetical protein KA535_06995 [Azonexus sp.]|nr:hypothetical protein [Azonexus sp.]